MLIILPPRVLALHATEETNLALISRSQLAHPPFSRIMAALGASHTGGGKGPSFLSIIYDGDLFFHALGFLHHPFVAFGIADVAAFPALQLTAGRHHEALAMWTEHHPV
jgi:hypothetical protein